MTDSVPMVTMMGLNPRSEISAVDQPDHRARRPGRRAIASQTGGPWVISQPQTQPASAAVPGMDRSSAPQMMPTATPAAKMAVSAAALAMRMALFRLAKYGLAQRLKPEQQRDPEHEDAPVAE